MEFSTNSSILDRSGSDPGLENTENNKNCESHSVEKKVWSQYLSSSLPPSPLIYQFLEPLCFVVISPITIMAANPQIFTGLTLASTPASSFQSSSSSSSSSSHSLCMVRKPLTTSFFGRGGMCLLILSFFGLMGIS